MTIYPAALLLCWTTAELQRGVDRVIHKRFYWSFEHITSFLYNSIVPLKCPTARSAVPNEDLLFLFYQRLSALLEPQPIPSNSGFPSFKRQQYFHGYRYGCLYIGKYSIFNLYSTEICIAKKCIFQSFKRSPFPPLFHI